MAGEVAAGLHEEAVAGQLEPDNLIAERAIRGFTVGRRNWLFSGTFAAAQRSALILSIVETCKANGIDPYRYLTWLFLRLPLAKTVDDYDALLPWKIPADLR